MRPVARAATRSSSCAGSDRQEGGTLLPSGTIENTGDGGEAVAGYSFSPGHLDPADRTPGISAMLRVRNGAEFVEAAIRSHARLVDEIVAVHHDCSDATPAILMRLAGELGPRLRVIHYRDRVAPLASDAYRALPADAPGSFVNFSNFAFAATRHTHFMLLDDDHVAWQAAMADLATRVRAGAMPAREMWCFSALNPMRGPDGGFGIASTDPLAGHGDHGFRQVLPGDAFRFDPRFERFGRNDRRRRFMGFGYWHMKYLKADAFANHDPTRAPGNRFNRKRQAFEGRAKALSLAQTAARETQRIPRHALSALFDDGHRLRLDRAFALRALSDEDVETLFERTAGMPMRDLLKAG